MQSAYPVEDKKGPVKQLSLFDEIELTDENEPFDKPAWLGEEVTGDPKYFNSMLMKNPYKNWK